MNIVKLANAKHLIEARNVVRDDRSDARAIKWACEVLANSPHADDRMIAKRLGVVVDHGLGQNADLFAEMQNGNGVALVVVLSATLVVTLAAAWLAFKFLPL